MVQTIREEENIASGANYAVQKNNVKGVRAGRHHCGLVFTEEQDRGLRVKAWAYARYHLGGGKVLMARSLIPADSGISTCIWTFLKREA